MLDLRHCEYYACPSFPAAQQYVYLNGTGCLWKCTQEMGNRVVSGQGSQRLRARDERKMYFLLYYHIILLFLKFIMYMHYLVKKNLSSHLKIQNFT